MIARVYKRGERWYADYTNHAGRRVRRVVPNVRTEKQALLELGEMLEEQKAIRKGYRDTLDNSAELGTILEAFLLHKVASRRYDTALFYRSALADVVGSFKTADGKAWPSRCPSAPEELRQQRRVFTPGSLGARRADEITSDTIDQYIDMHRGRLSTRTLNLRVMALKTLLTWARKNGRIKTNPIAEKSRVGRPAISHRALTVEEVEGLLAASPEPYQTIWLCFLTTGMRRSELIKLRWPQVDFATDTIRVLSETSKSKRQRDIPILPELRRRLAELKSRAEDPRAPVFANKVGRSWANNLPRRFAHCVAKAFVGRVRKLGGVWEMVYRCDDGHQVSEPLPGVKGWKCAKERLWELRGTNADGVSLHTLRHTFATQLLLNGANPKVVSELLGHSSITITLDIYGHVFPRDKRQVIEHLPYGTVVAQTGKSHLQSLAG